MDKEQNLQKAEEMKSNLVSQQTLLTKAESQREAAVKASFIVAEEIAKSAQAIYQESVFEAMHG